MSRREDAKTRRESGVYELLCAQRDCSARADGQSLYALVIFRLRRGVHTGTGKVLLAWASE
jgi:hypothetical protein